MARSQEGMKDAKFDEAVIKIGLGEYGFVLCVFTARAVCENWEIE